MELEPNRCYQTSADRGTTFFTNAEGKIFRVEATASGTGPLNPDLHNLLPDTTYVVNKNTVFQTDALSRPVQMDAYEMSVGKGARSEYTQGKVGAQGREEFPEADYEGGHLKGVQFLGPRERINYVPMLENINNARSSFIDQATGENFGTMENKIATILREKPDSVADLQVKPIYEGTGMVPVRIKAKWRIDGGEWIEREFVNVPG